MLTPCSLRRQIALYLAARQRLAELGEHDIVGVSVKCQNELSEDWGCTGCFLPAFLCLGLAPVVLGLLSNLTIH